MARCGSGRRMGHYMKNFAIQRMAGPAIGFRNHDILRRRRKARHKPPKQPRHEAADPDILSPPTALAAGYQSAVAVYCVRTPQARADSARCGVDVGSGMAACENTDRMEALCWAFG